MLRYLMAVLIGLLLCAPASAYVVREMVTKMTSKELRTRCDAEGGAFGTGGSGMSGCTKGNCDGKGGECNITCDANSNCVGTTPDLTFDLAGLTGGPPGKLAPPEVFGLKHVSKGQLQSACRSVPGALFGSSIPNGDHYFCGNPKCDPGVGPCYIECDLSKCTAGMPTKPTAGLTLVTILRAGDTVSHTYEQDEGATTKSNGGVPTPGPKAPAPPPVVIIP